MDLTAARGTVVDPAGATAEAVMAVVLVGATAVVAGVMVAVAGATAATVAGEPGDLPVRP